MFSAQETDRIQKSLFCSLLRHFNESLLYSFGGGNEAHRFDMAMGISYAMHYEHATMTFRLLSYYDGGQKSWLELLNSKKVWIIYCMIHLVFIFIEGPCLSFKITNRGLVTGLDNDFQILAIGTFGIYFPNQF